MRRILWSLALVGLLLLLPACSDNDNPNIDREGFNANFNPSEAIVPFPTNLLFSGTSDGTLNIPPSDPEKPDDISDPKVTMSKQDGFSTVAPISTTFNNAIDPMTFAPDNVLLFEVATSPEGAVLGVTRQLAYGMEYVATLSSVDATGQTLVILPLAPLSPSSSYLVGLTNSIKNTKGLSASADFVYVLTKSPDPLVDAEGNNLIPALTTFEVDEQTGEPIIDPETGLPVVDVEATNAKAQALEGLRQLVQTQEAALTGEGVVAEDIILSWTFNTQSVGDVLGVVNSIATGTSVINPAPIGTTADLLPPGASPGLANVYVGSLDVPYYLTAATGPQDPTPLGTWWLAANPAGAGDTERNLTRYNPLPAATSTETIPLLLSVPAAGTAPWPVVIFQHGITTDRSVMLAAADSLAAAGFAVVAIDMPLHGLDPSSPLYSGFERTFDLDFVNNTTGAPLDFAGGEMPDGADPSGTHYINLASLLTTRDNLRQSVADLFALTEALATMDYTGDGAADFDTDRIYFSGHSLGGMVGSVFLALEPDVRDAVIAMSGGGIAKLLDGSISFGPRIEAGLAAKGVVKGTPDYESFMGAFQTLIDSGDPVNYAVVTATGRGVLMFEVLGDTVVPNNVLADAPAGTVPSPLAGTDPLVFFLGLQTVSETTMGSDLKALMRFVEGDHGSILDPSASLLTTQVMQNAMATFLATDGGVVDVLDDTVLE